MATKRFYACCLIYFVVTIVVSLLIIWVGLRGPEKHWEGNAVEGQCLPVDYSTTTETCGDGHAIWECYNALMKVSVSVNGTLYYDTVNTYLGAVTIEKTIENMQKKYPPGQYFKCWYNHNDPSDVHLGMGSDTFYVVETVIVIGVSAVTTLIMIFKFRK